MNDDLTRQLKLWVYREAEKAWVHTKSGRRLPIISGGGKANVVQAAFWFRNNDGNEATATFMGSQGSDQSIPVDTIFRLRILLEETAGGTGTPAAGLRVSHQGGIYEDITASSQYVVAIDEGQGIADDAALTTQRLTYTGTYASGRYDDDGADTTAVTIDADSVNITEFEFSLRITGSQVANGQTLDFQVYDAGVAIDTYSVTPRATVVKVTSVSESETITVTDTPAVVPSTPAITESETVTVTDTPVVSVEEVIEDENVAEQENVSVTDTPTVEVIVDLVTSQAVGAATFGTAISIIYVTPQISESETVAVADTPAVDVQVEVVESEAVSVVDTPQLVVTDPNVSESEAVSVTDAPTVSLEGVPLSINVSDSITVVAIPRYYDDEIVLSEKISLDIVIPGEKAVSEAETISVAESVSLYIELDISESEAISVTDADNIALQAPQIAESESIAVAESVSLAVEAPQIVESEAIAVAESVSVEAQVDVVESESISVADTPIVIVSAPQVVESEAISVAESVSVEVQVDVAESEAVAVAESVQLLPSAAIISVSDSISVTDTPIVGTPYDPSQPNVQTSDNVSVTDTPSIAPPTIEIQRAGYQQKILGPMDDGSLIALWPLTEKTGSTADNAEGTATLDGTYVGTTLNSTPNPDTLPAPLIGTGSDVVDVYSSALNTALDREEGSLFIWAKVTGSGVWASATQQSIFRFLDDSFNKELFAVRKQISPADTLRFSVYIDGTQRNFDKDSMSTTGWFHVGLTWSLSENYARAWFDGELLEEGTYPGTPSGNPLESTIATLGAANNSGAESFDGYLSLANIWDAPLSPAQVANLFSLSPITEAVLITDTPLTDLQTSIAESEAVSVAESALASFQADVDESDAVSVAEDPSVDAQVDITESDAVSVTDTPQVEIQTDISASDAIGVAENVIVRTNLNAPLASDAISVADLPEPDVQVDIRNGGYLDKVRDKISTDLLAYWPLLEITGTNADNDVGDAAYDGTYEGPSLNATPNPDGRPAPQFGTGDNVDIYSTSLNTNFNRSEGAIFAWAKVENSGVWTDGDSGGIINLASLSAEFFRIVKAVGNNSIRFEAGAAGTDKVITLNGVSTTDWFSVGMVWSQANNFVRAYYNGALVGETSSIGTPVPQALFSNNCVIGAISRFASTFLGYVSYVGIWDDILSHADVADLSSITPMTESLSVVDAPVILLPELFLTASDAISVTDSETVTLPEIGTIQLSEQESVGVADTPVLDVIVEIDESEAISVTDTAAVDSPREIVESESIGVAEAVTLVVSDPQIVESESVSVAESVTVSIPGVGVASITEQENVSVSDSATVQVEVELVADESISVTDSPALDILVEIDESDAVAAADSATIAIGVVTTLTIAATDVVSLAENVEFFFSDPLIEVSDNISVGESHQVEVPPLYVFFDDRHGITVGMKSVTAQQLNGILITDL